MTISTVKVSDKGQISIPTRIREEADINRGDSLIIIQDNGRLIIEKAEKGEKIIKEKFKDLVKHSESIAEKLWSNKEDDVWDTL